jgi:hypothetical protein
MKISCVEVGLFKLPGVVIEGDSLTPKKIEEINAWCTENNCGKQMTHSLWSFKRPTQRDMFILRWSGDV